MAKKRTSKAASSRKSTKKAAKKSTTKKTTRAPRAAKSGIEQFSTAELSRELKRRERGIDKLLAKREKLLAQIAKVEAEIGDVPTTSRGTPRRRPRNDNSLGDALASMLKDKEMGVTEAAEAVQAAGYATSSANFRTIVNQTLLKDDRFKKVSRGVYTAA